MSSSRYIFLENDLTGNSQQCIWYQKCSWHSIFLSRNVQRRQKYLEYVYKYKKIDLFRFYFQYIFHQFGKDHKR